MLTTGRLGGSQTSPAADPPLPLDHDRIPTLARSEIVAKALREVWAGTPATVVASPPGGGKTLLVLVVAAHLAVRGHMRVAVASQTRRQALDLANRLAVAAPGCPTTLLWRSQDPRPTDLHPDVDYVHNAVKLTDEAGVVISTAARWQWVGQTILANSPTWTADVLAVDEAWQMTWAHLQSIGQVAAQLLLVGDPGQIAPVVTATTRRWAERRTGPHVPAPDALTAARPDHVRRFALPATRRCGPDTATAIAPLYPFEFGSVRPPRGVMLDGDPLGELTSVTTRSTASGPHDPMLATQVVAETFRLLRDGTYVDEHGRARPLTPTDVGVVCAHVAQVSAVRARLGPAFADVLVDTANRWQGLERIATVVWSPLAGKRTYADFDLDLGRACVALSRHVAHTVWVESPDTRNLLGAHGPQTDPARTATYLQLLSTLKPRDHA